MNALSQQERKNALLATMRGQIPEDDGESGAYKVSRFMDAINRGLLAGTAGAPADIAAWFMRQLGDKVENPVGGSEWIGQKMQDMGMVTANRDPLTETIASFANPVTAMGSLYKLFKAAPAIAGIFAGKNAKLADLLKLQEAEQMLARGDNAADVWRATGWGKGPDGHWRFEIPDNNPVSMRMNGPKWGTEEFTPMGDTLYHPELYANDPSLKDINVSYGNSGSGGSYNKSGPFEYVHMNNQALVGNQSTLLHELQHAIQTREGFARGGSPEQFYSEVMEEYKKTSPLLAPLYTDFAKRLANAGTDFRQVLALGKENPEEYKAINDVLRQLQVSTIDDAMAKARAISGDPLEQAAQRYKRLAGEAEARLTQSRIPLTQDERLAQYPWDPEYFQQATGVPVNKLIYRYGGGPAASVSPTEFELAHEVARKNAVEMLGLPESNTAMDRAAAMGFDLDVFHGSDNAAKVNAFDKGSVVDNVQYGGNFYTSTSPEYASKYADNFLRGDTPGVLPLKMKTGKRFNMDAPVSAEDAAKILEEMGQYERADAIRAYGKPYRSGSELFYFGIDPHASAETKGKYINAAGFNSIHGDPSLEIAGRAGKPHSVAFEPTQLRSRFAAFDPARADSSDILASLLGVTGAGYLYGREEE